MTDKIKCRLCGAMVQVVEPKPGYMRIGSHFIGHDSRNGPCPDGGAAKDGLNIPSLAPAAKGAINV